MYPKVLRYASLVLAISLIGFSSCKKKYSKDEPLPQIYQNSLYVGSDNQVLYSIDVATGKTNWEFVTQGKIKATPLIYKDAVFCATDAGNVYRLDRLTGKLLGGHFLTSISGPIVSTPIIVNDTIVVFTETGNIFYLNANDGSYLVGTTAFAGPVVASPTFTTILATGARAIIFATTGNEVVALSLEDIGTVLWRSTPPTAGSFISSPCANNGNTMYIGNTNGNLYAMDLATGNINWTYQTDGPISSSPISIGGNIVFGSADRKIYSIDSITGTPRWTVPTGDRVESSPYYANQMIYIGSNDNNLYAIDIINGILKWKKPTFGIIVSSPIAIGDNVYVASYDKNLYKISAEDGSTKSVFNVNGLVQTSPIIDTIGGVIYPSIYGGYRY